jgi:hypothetical protein
MGNKYGICITGLCSQRCHLLPLWDDGTHIFLCWGGCEGLTRKQFDGAGSGAIVAFIFPLEVGRGFSLHAIITRYPIPSDIATLLDCNSLC